MSLSNSNRKVFSDEHPPKIHLLISRQNGWLRVVAVKFQRGMEIKPVLFKPKNLSVDVALIG